MDSLRPICARSPRHAGFTLVEVLIASSLSLVLMVGLMSAYLFIGRNFTRLASTQQQDVKARRALFQFAQDVGKAISFSSTTTSNLTFTAPITLSGCSTTAASATVTCASTSALSAGLAIWSVPPILVTNCTTVTGSATVTCTSTVGLYAGVIIAGAGLPTTGLPALPVTVASITNGTTFVISTNATSNNSGVTLYAMVDNVPDGTTVSSVTNGTTFVMSANAKATTSNVSLYTTTAITYAYNSGAGTLTRTAGSAAATTLLTDIDSTASNPSNGFACYNQFGTALTSTTSVRAVEFTFTTKVGNAQGGTQASYKIVSPRVVVRNNNTQ